MSYARIPVGDALALNALLSDGDSSKFVRAHIFDEDFIEVGGSPVALTHVALGLYSNNAVILAEGRYLVVYIVYNDAGFTVLSKHGRTQDTFDVMKKIEDAVADKVWTVQRSGLQPSGSFGEILDAKITTREADSDALNRFNLTAKQQKSLDIEAAMAKDATVAKETTLNTKASQSSVNTIDTTVNAVGSLVATKASQASVNAIPTNPLLDNDPVLNNLDVPVSSRESESDAGARAVAGAKQADLLLIKGKTDQVSFTGPNLNANAQVVADKTGYGLSVPEKADIADRIWDEPSGDHVAAGSTGKKLSDLSSSSPSAIASAVWEELASAHVGAGTFGGAFGVLGTGVSGIDTDTNELLARLTGTRAALLDNLDATVSSRQSQADADAKEAINQAEHDFSQVQLAAIAAGLGSDPNGLSILTLLNNATYGLSALRIQLDGKATLATQNTHNPKLDALQASLDDGTVGLAALAALIAQNYGELTDGTSGLAALRTQLDDKALAAQVAALPNASAMATAVWAALTAPPQIAGSFGDRVKSLLDAAISTRGSGVQSTAIDLLVTQVKALLENVTFGLAALKGEIDANEVKIDNLDADVANVDGDVAASNAAILAAIGAIVSGTPTILAALDTIKGPAWVGGSDNLHEIKQAIGTGSATLANQTAILTKLNDIHGPAPGALDNLKNIRLDVNGVLGEVQTTHTDLGSKIDTVETKVDGVDSGVAAATARLDHVNYGLAAAKSDRDSYASSDASAHAVTQGKEDDVLNFLTAIDSDADTNTADILNAVGAIDSTTMLAQLNGIIALLNNGSFGLLAIKNLTDNGFLAEANTLTTVLADIAQVNSDVDAMAAVLENIKGAGWTVAHTLKAIGEAVAELDLENDTQATAAQAQTILDSLNLMAGTGFNTATDSLAVIAEKHSFLEGFEGGQG